MEENFLTFQGDKLKTSLFSSSISFQYSNSKVLSYYNDGIDLMLGFPHTFP